MATMSPIFKINNLLFFLKFQIKEQNLSFSDFKYAQVNSKKVKLPKLNKFFLN